MLEKLWFREEAEGNLFQNFLFSFFFGLASVILARYFVVMKFGGMDFGGLVSVFLVSLAASYPIVMFLEKRRKEKRRLKGVKETKLLGRHRDELFVYISFFLGITAAFSVSYFIFPGDFFSIQTQTIGSITGQVTEGSLLSSILQNNLFVFSSIFLLSFIISAGMIFILAWNASVLGIFLSKISLNLLAVPVAALYYLPHGLVEISAYILAGISGFLFSRQMEDFKHFKMVFFKDSLFLLFIGLGALFLAAGLEVL